MGILSTTIDINTIRSIATLLGFANSFMTFVILQVLNRKMFARWRMRSFVTLVLLWGGIVPCVFELILPIHISPLNFQNAGTKVGLASWLFGLVLLVNIISKILRADLIGFRKPEANFVAQERFGVRVMDTLISQAKEEGKKLYYPVLLIGDRAANPHHFLLDFIMSGIENGGSAIYFTFTRPPEIIIAQFERRGLSQEEHGIQLIIVDCYTPLITQGKSVKMNGFLEKNKITILSADPKNPHDVNKVYEKAIKKVIDRKYNKLRVGYDSFSDFLLFADPEIIITYLRHNVVWEERNGVQAIYVLWPEALEKPLSDSYLIWFSNTPIWLNTKGKYLLLTIQSLFQEPRSYQVDYQYEIIKEIPGGIDDAGRS